LTRLEARENFLNFLKESIVVNAAYTPLYVRDCGFAKFLTERIECLSTVKLRLGKSKLIYLPGR
jgi:hypothetical protein